MLWQVLIGAAAVFSLLYWLRYATLPEGHSSWAGTLGKTAATGLLALGFCLSGAPGALVAGLFLGAIGDFALSRPGERWFLAGMGAFAAGHLAYTVWLASMGGQAWAFPDGPVQVAGAALLAGLVLSTEVWLAPFAGALRGPVRAYVLVIAAMAGFALMLPAQGTAARVIQIGALSFVLSDFLLALRLFRARDPALSRRLGALVWPLYWAGQALILTGGLHFASGPQG